MGACRCRRLRNAFQKRSRMSVAFLVRWDMKQPFFPIWPPAAALLHVVSASADPSRHDQAARTLDRMSADEKGWRVYVRERVHVCVGLWGERVVRCEPKFQTQTSNTMFRVLLTRSMKAGHYRQAALQARERRGSARIRYHGLLPAYSVSKINVHIPASGSRSFLGREHSVVAANRLCVMHAARMRTVCTLYPMQQYSDQC